MLFNSNDRTAAAFYRRLSGLGHDMLTLRFSLLLALTIFVGGSTLIPLSSFFGIASSPCGSGKWLILHCKTLLCKIIAMLLSTPELSLWSATASFLRQARPWSR